MSFLALTPRGDFLGLADTFAGARACAEDFGPGAYVERDGVVLARVVPWEVQVPLETGRVWSNFSMPLSAGVH